MSKTNFEEKYLKLEEILKQLQSEQLNIDDSIELFKQGIILKNQCSEIIENAQMQVNEIIEGENNEHN